MESAGFKSTKVALVLLQRLLFCSRCSKLAKNVCSLGNCEHLFCKHCAEAQLGSSCPVCDMPTHAKDTQVSRQLSNIASLSLELCRVLEGEGVSCPDIQDQSQLEQEAASTAYRSPSPHLSSAERATENVCSQHLPSPSPPASINGDACHKKVSPLGHRKTPKVSSEIARRPRSEEQQPRVVRKTADAAAGMDAKLTVRGNKGARAASVKNQGMDGPSVNLDSIIPTDDLGECQQTPVSVLRRRRSRLQELPENDSPKQLQSPCTRLFTTGNMEYSLEDLKGHSQTSTLSLKVKETSDRSIKMSRGTKIKQTGAFSTDVEIPTVTARSSRSKRDSQPALTTCLQQADLKSPIFSHSAFAETASNKISPQRIRVPVKAPVKTARRRSAPARSSVSEAEAPCPEALTNPRMKRGSMPLAVANLPCSLKHSPQSCQLSTTPTIKTPSSRNTRVPVTKRNAKGETALHVAAIKGDFSAVQELLSKGENPNVRDNAGWTPLHEAVNRGNVAITEVLLQHGAMVNMPGMENDTPLHDAVTNGHVDCVRLLIMCGASVSTRNIYGKTAVEMARTAEMQEVLKQTSLVHPPTTAALQVEDSNDLLPLCFLGTALNRDQRILLQKCATMLHAKVVEDCTPEVTHVVSSVNASGQSPRTSKYLSAIVGGKWIVSIDWVNICLEYGEKVSEEPFEVPGCSTHPNSHAPHEARMNIKLQLPPLFDGCQVYLRGSFSRLPPNRRELADLLRLGGAQLLTREPRLSSLDEYQTTVPYHAPAGSSLVDCGIYIVHDDCTKVQAIEAHRMRTVPVSWVVDCIATFSIVEPQSKAL